MFTTLYGKLAAVLFGLFCLIGAGMILLTLYTTHLHFQEVSQKLNQTLAERLVSENVLLQAGQVNEAALKDLFHMLMVINPSIEVYLLDAHGTILTYSAPSGKVKRQRVSLDAVERFLSRAEDFPILGDDPRDLTRQKIFSAFPIESLSGTVEGYLYVILVGEEFDSAATMLAESYILRLSSWSVAAILLLSLVTGLVLVKLITRRIRRLALSMEAFKQSDFLALPWPSSQSQSLSLRGDEIDELGQIYAQMADRIQQQVRQLQQTDQLRRELVADVSHDLRTPLTSLQGYLETLLLKESALSAQEQRNYLEIATAQSKHLGKLIADLFDLAKLNAQEMVPHRESFALGELAQDVVQQFHLLVEKKRLTIQLRAEPDLPLVSADIGLIERVLENLIANAVRHTEERGTVIVAISHKASQIVTEVSDTGCGISAEDLPCIFDRYYRVHNSRQARTAGAGLGLAIAKRILELHGRGIEVQSVLNEGTTFRFYLSPALPSSTAHDRNPCDRNVTIP
ncbi:MAG TPA: ATP-binding protein [Nitrospira sp.]|nr:ATP-binding protein [Nitrospira sp.]